MSPCVCMYIHILTVKQQIWSRCCSSSHRRGALTGKLRVEKKAEDIHNWCQAKLNFPLRGIKGNPISPFYSSTSRAMSRLSTLKNSSSRQNCICLRLERLIKTKILLKRRKKNPLGLLKAYKCWSLDGLVVVWSSKVHLYKKIHT